MKQGKQSGVLAGLLYFVSGRTGIVNPTVAKELGLGYAFSGCGISSAHADDGPGSKPGMVFGASGADVRYKPKRQVWQPYPGKEEEEKEDEEKLFLGMWKDSPPGPEYFERKQQFDGHMVKLTDGNEWLVPVARAVDGTTPLPRPLKRGAGGWVPGEQPLAQYRDIFGHACRVWDQLASNNGQPKEKKEEIVISLDEEVDIAAMALGINYRVSAAEISLLGLFDTRNCAEVVLALIDFPAIRELLKKKQESDAASMTPGAGA